jgi:hypothetical protein
MLKQKVFSKQQGEEEEERKDGGTRNLKGLSGGA